MHTHVHGRERSARKEQVTHDLHFDEENGTSGRLENGRPRGPVLSHYTSQERQPAAVTELPNNQPQPIKKKKKNSGAMTSNLMLRKDFLVFRSIILALFDQYNYGPLFCDV